MLGCRKNPKTKENALTHPTRQMTIHRNCQLINQKKHLKKTYIYQSSETNEMLNACKTGSRRLQIPRFTPLGGMGAPQTYHPKSWGQVEPASCNASSAAQCTSSLGLSERSERSGRALGIHSELKQREVINLKAEGISQPTGNHHPCQLLLP